MFLLLTFTFHGRGMAPHPTLLPKGEKGRASDDAERTMAPSVQVSRHVNATEEAETNPLPVSASAA